MMTWVLPVREDRLCLTGSNGSTTAKRSRRNFLGQVGAAAPAVLLHRCGVEEDSSKRSRSRDRPNVLLITADDLHWQSPNCFGGRTPEATKTELQQGERTVNLSRVQAASWEVSRKHIKRTNAYRATRSRRATIY